MKRLVKYNFIGDSSSKMYAKINELNEEIRILNEDISKIEDSYKGKDAEEIISKYRLKIDYIESYLTIISNYQKYFDWLSGRYRDTHQKALKDISSFSDFLSDNKDVVDTDKLSQVESLYEGI